MNSPSMKSRRMSKTTMFAVLAACACIHIAAAQAQRVPDTQTSESPRATRPLVHCATRDAGTDAAHPCRSERGRHGRHIASEPSRQELDCVLWGTCPEGNRPPVNG